MVLARKYIQHAFVSISFDRCEEFRTCEKSSRRKINHGVSGKCRGHSDKGV